MKEVFLLFFGLICAISIGQSCDVSKELNAIETLIKKGSFKRALQDLNGLKECEKIGSEEMVSLLVYEYKAYRNDYKFKDAENALLAAKQILEKHSKHLPFEFRFLLAENYAHLAKIDEYLKLIKPIEDSVLSPLNKSEELLGRYYLASFRTTSKRDNLTQAINHLLEALKHFEKLKDPPIFYCGNNLRSLGNMYRTAGDFDKSNFYYKKGRAFVAKHYPANHFEIAYYDYTIGAVYYEKMEYRDALDYFLEARKVWKDMLPPEARYMRYLNESIGDMYWELDDPKNALIYFNHSIVDEKKVNNDASENSIKTADSLIENGNYADALAYYKEAYRWREKEFGKNNVQTGACKNFVARAIRYSGDTEGALTAYQEAINILVSDLKETSWYANPTSKMDIQSHQYLQESLIAKGDLLKELYTKTNKISDLEAALQTHQVAIELLEDLKNNQLSEASRAFWTQRTLTLIESSIDTAIRLNEITNDDKYLQKAFNFSERSKALLLLASLYDHEIKSFANVSEEIIKEENQLKKSIHDYIGKIETEEKRCADVRTKILTLWKTELNALQSEYDLLVQRIQNEYPEYYQLKYGLQIAEVSAIQDQLLTREKALISYFSGTDNIYVFRITKSNIAIRKIEKAPELYEKIDGFFKNISSQQTLQTSPQEVFESYTKEGFSLYKHLLQPELVGENFNELIVIPDGKLCYIPFESILTHEIIDKNRNYNALPYLLKGYSISYSPSASIQLLTKNDDKTHDHYLGFAPNYDGQVYGNSSRDAATLRNLKYNTQEVHIANQLFKGNQWTGNLVTENLLKSESAEAGILHLAMHGAIEDEHPLLSKLYFNSSASEDGMLHIYEIYNMELSAQLVILSACNTAAGKLVRGEGIVSLERAFQYAGSKAMLSTLWKVDDAATLELTEAFLNNLKAGSPKNKALRDAKLQFLASATPEKLAPFYWSSFKLTGNTEPLKLKSKMLYLYVGFVIVGMLFGITFVRHRFKGRRQVSKRKEV